MFFLNFIKSLIMNLNIYQITPIQLSSLDNTGLRDVQVKRVTNSVFSTC